LKSQPTPFNAAHAFLQHQVDAQLLAGVSMVVLKDGAVIHRFCTGLANLQIGEALRPDHIHRAFSNTKLMTSVLVLMLVDQGRFALDDPIKTWIPVFGKLQVLKAGATTLSDTEGLQSDITVRHLLSHQAGLSHGVFDPGTLIYNAYHAAGVRRPDTTLEVLMDQLASLPLIYQPGTAWEYSMATDVLARLVEIVTGQTFGAALQARLLDPLGMVDTGHVLRPDQVARLCPLYVGDLANPDKPGVTRLDNVPWPDAFLKPVARQAGSSGLITTEADMVKLMGQLLPQPGGLLKPATLAEMMRDQLPPDRCVQFFLSGPIPSLGFGLGGAVTRSASELQPNSPVGEFQWGGLAGTHWSISPATGVAIVLMTQRHMGFWHPFWFKVKREVYAAFD
jgi:CubicO group peptidase (beta-lactamase class C family)